MSGAPSNTFCPLPWIHLDAKTSGEVRVCCQAHHGPKKGILTNEQGEIFNVSTSTTAESRNAPLMKEVRKAILEGEFHPECRRCKIEEESGVPSSRMIQGEIWKDRFDYARAQQVTDCEGALIEPVPVMYYSLRFGNSCNLRCRTCGPTESDAWYDDFVALNGYQGFRDGFSRVALVRSENGRYHDPSHQYRRYESEQFWQDLANNAEGIRTINIAGGEPMLIRRHFDFLKQLVSTGYAKNITLEYNTNATVLPKQVLELWESFKFVKLSCSIDGVGPVNDYLRHPSKFSVLERNLHTIDRLGPNVMAWINFTVSALNIYYLDEVIKWKMQQGFQKINSITGFMPLITAHPLHRPDYYSAKILPAHAKRVISEKLKALEVWIRTFAEASQYDGVRENLVRSSQHLVEGYINMMNNDDWSHLLSEFWAKTRRLDAIRGQSIERSLPEFYQLIKESEVSTVMSGEGVALK